MRPAVLGRVIEHAETVLRDAPNVPPAGLDVANRSFRALNGPSAHRAESANDRPTDALPACSWLADGLRRALAEDPPTAQLGAALRDVASLLHWERRPQAVTDPEGFFDGHANAILVGPSGIERRHDVTMGLSLMAPHVQYPDHLHAPEEFYVVLSPGQWRRGVGPWYEPGPGGVVHHAPNILHAMRSGDRPLLALWFLWTP